MCAKSTSMIARKLRTTKTTAMRPILAHNWRARLSTGLFLLLFLTRMTHSLMRLGRAAGPESNTNPNKIISDMNSHEGNNGTQKQADFSSKRTRERTTTSALSRQREVCANLM